MKGLLLKDLYFITRQTKMFFIIGFMFVLFYLTQGLDSAPFIISYTTMMGAILVLSTISYDDYENSGAFLMTLPITRKEYVLGKYVFGVLGCCTAWCLSVLLYFVLNAQEFSELVCMAAFLLAAILAVEVLLIPIQLKFGSEKGRMALIGIFVMGMLLVAAVKKVMGSLAVSRPEMKDGFLEIVGKISAMSPWVVLLMVFFAVGVEAVISYNISRVIMEKKEY